MMLTLSSKSLMGTWSKVFSSFPHLASTSLNLNPRPGPAAQIMPTLLVRGHHPERDGTPGGGPLAALESFVPTDRFLSQPKSVQEEMETKCQGKEGAWPHQRAKAMGIQRPRPPPSTQTTWPWLVTVHYF